MISRILCTVKLVLVVSQIIWLGGCVNLSYYAQAVSGHMELLHRSKPISKIIADPETDHKLRSALAKVIILREFASRELKLPDNKSYTSYADLQRPYVVWNVFASPELSVELKEWCFIKAGCVNYRGFFSETKAKRYAEKLKNDGYDVYVGGVRAYSTLGWFNDPILNTFIGYSETDLARLIFHELAHQVVYVPGDTVFNESFATTVEYEGVTRWFESNGTSAEQVTFHKKKKIKTIFIKLVLEHRQHLQTLFSTNISDADKRIGKLRLSDKLHKQFLQLKTATPELNRYDLWFKQQPNNAQLATVSVYTQWLPAFQSLLVQQNGDMNQFFEVVKEISKLPQNERVSILQSAIDNVISTNLLSNANFEIND
jgi:predicted aminopeptidase